MYCIGCCGDESDKSRIHSSSSQQRKLCNPLFRYTRKCYKIDLDFVDFSELLQRFQDTQVGIFRVVDDFHEVC